jgi:hypothetical protein
MLFAVGCALATVPIFLKVRPTPSRAKSFVRRLWGFYRRGVVAEDSNLAVISISDSLSKLRDARRNFVLESHVTPVWPRPTVVHCPNVPDDSGGAAGGSGGMS